MSELNGFEFKLYTNHQRYTVHNDVKIWNTIQIQKQRNEPEIKAPLPLGDAT